MSKVTSKRQVTIPKKIADQYGIAPGAVIRWEPAGDVIRVVPPEQEASGLSPEERLVLFDRATDRRTDRPVTHSLEESDRGWTREELHDRARTR
jgi:bifunctional DNA-binding transcriptional regulator/antitoxin component of YhaV-PrlF toxin-antitoxin module